MFGRLMNNYYYGKSGKGDFRKEDMPENRWQLFWDVLRTRLSALVRLNLMYMVVWLPTMIVMLLTFVAGYQHLGEVLAAQEGTLRTAIEESADEETASMYTEERIAELENGCWVCVRPSGTEPKIKLYVNTNAKDRAEAEKLNAELCEASQALMK